MPRGRARDINYNKIKKNASLLLRASAVRDLQATEKASGGFLLFVTGDVVIVRGRPDYSLIFSVERQAFERQNLFRWRHFETNSDRLIKRFPFSAFMMASFSSRHRLPRLAPQVYAAARFTISQLIVKILLFSFRFQMCFDNYVSSTYFLLLNDFMWFL